MGLCDETFRILMISLVKLRKSYDNLNKDLRKGIYFFSIICVCVCCVYMSVCCVWVAFVVAVVCVYSTCMTVGGQLLELLSPSSVGGLSIIHRF